MFELKLKRKRVFSSCMNLKRFPRHLSLIIGHWCTFVLQCKEKYQKVQHTTAQNVFFVNLNAVLDNLKCLDEVSSWEKDEAVGAGPPVNFLPAGFKIKAPSSGLMGRGGQQYFLNKPVYSCVYIFFSMHRRSEQIFYGERLVSVFGNERYARSDHFSKAFQADCYCCFWFLSSATFSFLSRRRRCSDHGVYLVHFVVVFTLKSAAQVFLKERGRIQHWHFALSSKSSAFLILLNGAAITAQSCTPLPVWSLE